MAKQNFKNINKKFFNSLKTSLVEKDVENSYRETLHALYPNAQFSSPYGTDGVLSTLFVKILLEAKHGANFLERKEQCEVLVQTIYYLKKFDDDFEEKPNIVFIGDENECFVLHGNHLYPYLEEEVDWNLAPSTAAKNNPKLVLELQKDKNITPFVFSIDKDFDIKMVYDVLESYSNTSEKLRIDINEKNISRIYDDFVRTVIRYENAKKYSPNELVSIFIQTMTDSINTYIVPGRINTLHLPNGKEIQIDGIAFNAFFCQFNRNYAPKELEVFTAIADRLIEDTSRRYQGSFWTPNIWVDKAISMLDDELGSDWRDKYVVWDCSCGSMNLTRDYCFKELYCSTLFQEELEIGKHYNPEAIKFQYDFLNDDVDSHMCSSTKLPNELIESLKAKKPFVFFNNPPYATANVNGSKGDHKAGVAQNKMNDLMIEQGGGKASQQLYAQFLWRIMNIVDEFELDNVVIATYTKPLFLTGSTFQAFRDRMNKKYEYKQGILFNASNFADVKDSWGILFSIFKKETIPTQKDFLTRVCEIKNNEICEIEDKILYNTDYSTSLSDWANCDKKTKKLPKDSFVPLSSAIKISGGSKPCGSLTEDSLGYLVNVANNVYKSNRDVFLLSQPAYMGHGFNVTKKNFDRVISLLAARGLVKGNWINDKDEFLAPDISNPKYNEWLNDCLIFSLFSTKSSQSSLRKFQYQDKEYNVQNHWFWMSVEEIKIYANNAKYNNLYNDARTDKNRYVYNLIKNIEEKNEFSNCALAVLEKAREIVKCTIEDGFREQLSIEHPEYHLDSWDAGWYQIKLILNAYDLEQLKEFNLLFKKLEDKMRPMIYELGFLKK